MDEGTLGIAYVLENGRVVLEGKGSELLENEQVKQAFLGIWNRCLRADHLSV